jgi:hypothetical protein
LSSNEAELLERRDCTGREWLARLRQAAAVSRDGYRAARIDPARLAELAESDGVALPVRIASAIATPPDRRASDLVQRIAADCVEPVTRARILRIANADEDDDLAAELERLSAELRRPFTTARAP